MDGGRRPRWPEASRTEEDVRQHQAAGEDGARGDGREDEIYDEGHEEVPDEEDLRERLRHQRLARRDGRDEEERGHRVVGGSRQGGADQAGPEIGRAPHRAQVFNPEVQRERSGEIPVLVISQ